MQHNGYIDASYIQPRRTLLLGLVLRGAIGRAVTDQVKADIEKCGKKLPTLI